MSFPTHLMQSVADKICHIRQGMLHLNQGRIQGGPGGPGPPLTTKNEAPAPKFYKTEAPEWQF